MFIQRRNGNSSVSSDPGERYIRVPEHGLSNSSSYEMSAASMQPSQLQPNVAAGEYPSVFTVPSEVTSVKESGDDHGESYIRLEDCYSGQPVGNSGTLPLLPTSNGGRTVSPNKASKQVCASTTIDVDADHRVEYCNEYELGEHDPTFITGNSNCDYTVEAVGVSGCADDDDDNVDYCHYKYPTVRYSVPSVSSELNEPRNLTGCLFREPQYVNCSNMSDWNLSCPPVKRHGIFLNSVLTYPERPELFYEQSLLVSASEHHTVGPYTADSWNSCRFYPSPSATGMSKAHGDDSDDDNDYEVAHDYVNVLPLHSPV